jgi:Xaa-Pro dipeptidase
VRDPNGISTAELAERRERVLRHVADERLSGYVVFDQHYIRYLTNFSFLATERPVALASDASGNLMVFVPEFEVERVRAETDFERVESYPEYPGLEHPMRILARVLLDMGIAGSVGADQDGYPGILGYEGPSLSESINGKVSQLAPVLEAMLVLKSAAEVELIRESGRWCSHAHRLLQAYSVPGATEASAGLRAGYESTLAMHEALGATYGGGLSSTDGVSAGYRGQIGKRSSWAHAIAHNIAFEAGDVLVSETSAPIWGYNAELERAMIIGEPTAHMRRLFDHMLGARAAALGALRPGVTCADVDQAVLSYFEANSILHYWKQHTGHAIGLRNHEAPFLDIGDFTPIEPGMVFTIEPGVYDGGLGGFRHSDTALVTPDGFELLTSYPTEIDELTIPA